MEQLKVILELVVRATRPRRAFAVLTACGGLLLIMVAFHNEGSPTNLMLDEKAEAERLHTTTAQPQANDTWINVRQNLLLSTSTTKILVLSYMRSGASFVNQLFNLDPRAFYWYEPLDAFYSTYFGFPVFTVPEHITYHWNASFRHLPEQEQGLLADYFNNMYSCRYDRLPAETFGHSFLYQAAAMSNYTKCITGYEQLSALDANLILSLDSMDQPVADRRDPSTDRRDPSTPVMRYINLCNEKLGDICDDKVFHMPNVTRTRINKCTEIIVAIKKMRLDQVTDGNSLADAVEAEAGPLWPSVRERILRFVDHEECVRTFADKVLLCLPHATATCQRRTLHAASVMRLAMEYMDLILRTIPDLHVLHLVRDPRAILASRHRIPMVMWDPYFHSLTVEAQILCDKMWRDIVSQRNLNVKFPGAIHVVRYEDVVAEVNATSNFIYSQLQLENVPSEWLQYARTTMFSSRDTGRFGTTTRNATESATFFRKIFDGPTLQSMNKICSKVIAHYRYG